MNCIYFLLLFFVVATSGVRIKVANTLGKGVFINIFCDNGNKQIASKTHVGDGDDLQFTFNNNCGNDVICGGTTSHQKLWGVVICKGCNCGDAGFFLRNTGIFRGTLTGRDLVKVKDVTLL